MPRANQRLSSPDRRRQILGVSAKLFARRGFRGTTTRQIAEHAHINEAILFRHFPRKEDLYWAILDDKTRSSSGRAELDQLLHSEGDDREVFAAIAEGILRRNFQDSSLSRLLLFSALEHHRLSRRFFQTHVERFYDVLARHIRARIRSGKFRRVDPLLAARGFIGMVAYHYQILELYGDRRYDVSDLRRVCRTLAEIWVEGMLARQEGALEVKHARHRRLPGAPRNVTAKGAESSRNGRT